MDFSNLGNEIFGYRRIHSTMDPPRGFRDEWKSESFTSYAEYLQTRHWKQLRQRILDRDHYQCALCDKPRRLQVHHKTYQRLGHERDSDLITLCFRCHEKHHDKAVL